MKHSPNRGVLEQGIEFLPKPYTAADLAREVRRVLDGQGSPGSQTDCATANDSGSGPEEQ